MTRVPIDLLNGLADRLYAWPGSRDVFAATDVLVWTEPPGKTFVAFKGSASKIEAIYKRPQIRNFQYGVDASMQQALGFAAEVLFERGRATGLRGDLGQRLSAGDFHFAEGLEAVSSLAAELFATRLGGKADDYPVLATFMPDEGSPIAPFYSAKRRKWLPAGKPPPAIEILTSEGARSRGADLGKLFDRSIPLSDSICAAGRSGGFFVFHCTTPGAKTGRSALHSGPSWVFPSLGVGTAPSVQFGPLALYASVDLVLLSLAPYTRSRSARPVTVYETDSWTVSGRGLEEAAETLYNQLVGHHEETIYGSHGDAGGTGPHQWILGAPATNWVGAVGEVQSITTTRALMVALRKRNRLWHRGIDDLAADHLSTLDDRRRYPYLEAKANLALPTSVWKLAIAPRSWESTSKAWLASIGCRAPLVTIADPEGPASNARDWNVPAGRLLRYSYRVADAADAFARERGLVKGFEE